MEAVRLQATIEKADIPYIQRFLIRYFCKRSLF